MRVFDYQCPEGHVTEQFVNDINQLLSCSTCGAITKRLVSTPTINLEGCTGAFPGAALKWDKKRQEKMAQEKRRDTWQTLPR